MENNISLQKDWFIRTNNDQTIDKCYDFDLKKLLGSGSYGDVIKATVKDAKTQKRAIKVIKKSRVKDPARFKMEIDIMRELDHPHIIKLFEVFEDTRFVYLVMELCEGGELFDRIIENVHFTESMARYYFKQMMGALSYIHSKNICHRDLKPENFLMLDNSEQSPLKIIDFGLSIKLADEKKSESKKQSMKTRAGTPYYISPEVLKGDYDLGCDIWSQGVILYILLSGVPPFYGNTDNDILNMVRAGQFSFKIEEFKVVSNQAKDLITKMLTKPEVRLTASQVLDHPWMKVEDRKDDEKLQMNIATLKNFQNSNRFKKVVLTFIASQMNETEIIRIGKEFQKLDKNNDGVLTADEIKDGFKDSNMTNQEIQQILASIDTDNSGSINYTEFIAASMHKQTYMKEDKLLQAFNSIDRDRSGKISAQELARLLGQNDDSNHQYFQDIIKENDKNGDGQIDYNEFKDMMSRGCA